MVTKAVNQIWWSSANVFFGTTGAVPSTSVGHITQDGAEAAFSQEMGMAYVEDYRGPVYAVPIQEELRVTFNLAQAEVDTLAFALGVATDGQKVHIGEQTRVNKAVKIVGTDQAGNAITCVLWNGQVSGNLTVNPKRREMVGIPVEVVGLVDTTQGEVGYWLFGTTAYEVTVSTGAITRPQNEGYVMVLGEGGVADDLDTINGTGLTNAETLRIQIQDTDSPITVIHTDPPAANQIMLDTASHEGISSGDGFVLSELGDYIDVSFNSGATRWDEIARFKA